MSVTNYSLMGKPNRYLELSPFFLPVRSRAHGLFQVHLILQKQQICLGGKCLCASQLEQAV